MKNRTQKNCTFAMMIVMMTRKADLVLNCIKQDLFE